MLLFVFWYCHKRGKEVRLEKERMLTEDEVAKLDVDYKAQHPGEDFTTTAAIGASMEEVQAGVLEAEAAKEAAAMEPAPDSETKEHVDPAIVPPTTVPT